MDVADPQYALRVLRKNCFIIYNGDFKYMLKKLSLLWKLHYYGKSNVEFSANLKSEKNKCIQGAVQI